MESSYLGQWFWTVWGYFYTTPYELCFFGCLGPYTKLSHVFGMYPLDDNFRDDPRQQVATGRTAPKTQSRRGIWTHFWERYNLDKSDLFGTSKYFWNYKNHESNAKIDKRLPQKMNKVISHSWKTVTHPNVSSCLVTHFFSRDTGWWSSCGSSRGSKRLVSSPR